MEKSTDIAKVQNEEVIDDSWITEEDKRALIENIKVVYHKTSL